MSNGKLYTGSINLNKVNKNKLFTSKKNEVWLNISIWLNENVDEYGNVISIQQQTKKDEKVIYIGNAKEYVKDKPTPEASTPNTENKPIDDLPW